MTIDRMRDAIELIDAANREDPRGKEVLYAERMSRMLGILAPDAGEALRVAVRAQHLQRWQIPRDQFPRNRVGYLAWRSELAKLHATKVGELLTRVGWDSASIARVQALVLKKNRTRDPEAQTLEDCACLVFLMHEAEPFAAVHPTDKVVTILQKTWIKMSEEAQKMALELELPPSIRDSITIALASTNR